MKKLSILTALVLATAAVNAHAQETFGDVPTTKTHKSAKHHQKHQGGFVDPKAPINKVSESSQWQDDQRIVLVGHIVKQVNKEDYIFRDDSGELQVEIERKAWKGTQVTPEDKVKLFAKVDKSDKKFEVEVKRVVKEK
ncbi:YgiW/YdeI family stress tolerance OB fold protein [Basilea psittacipulmonis]|uniref:Uncharacterized protein n=1 Tax=Basilea psittacipulmonis DSM 24701 TaxID=1072685 RepID=A0A077DFZ1_9BURK|nr:NirD/YgiW/YdeI family stress tolerance protein [Basilea psittacipulmonis]AIL32327.1 hypothetical protein IX83_02440 [Basilea psittacipulmonis DSM 24701]